jgi:tetrahydromethanopterin S-methyltransferase subunit G
MPGLASTERLFAVARTRQITYFEDSTMTTATNTDLQQLKDLINAGNIATQKQIADLATTTQKQITDLTLEIKANYAQLDKRIEVGFTKVDGDFKELRSELKGLDAKIEEKTKNLDQRLSGKEFTARSIIIGIITGLLLAFSKFLFTGKFL